MLAPTEFAMSPAGPQPLLASQHLALTVTDIDASVTWYRQVLGLEPLATLPHEGGYGILLATPDQQLFLVLHHHDANGGQPATEVRTGLDHVGLLVQDLDELERWHA
jgi:glyoxylase I family protein